MSEFINNKEVRTEKLLEFYEGFISDKDGLTLVNEYRKFIDQIVPMDMVIIVDEVMAKGYNIVTIKKVLDKIMNVIYNPLSDYKWDKPASPHPIIDLIEENNKLEEILNELKTTIRNQDVIKLREYLKKLSEFEVHYLKKENVLFPYLEKVWKNYKCLQLHWSIHDDIRIKLKESIAYAKKVQSFDHNLNMLIGELFFLMFGMVIKDNIVLLPAAYESLSNEDWKEIDAQDREIGFAYYTPHSERFSSEIKSENKKDKDNGRIVFGTGNLTKEQIYTMINTIPADITFIDENDEVKFFSKPDDRFFQRSTAIIGRKVQNCHPPESVHMVEKILDSFKSGDKKKARFWISMRGKFILIEYYAMRDENGNYMGTLEVSQDITDIKNLSGERRLLEWE